MATPKKKSVLTDRQQEVADMLLDGKAPQAPGGNGSKIAKTPIVQAYVRGMRDELSDLTQLKRVDIIMGMTDAIEMARLAADPSAMIKGWSEVAKLLGLYAPEVKKVEMSIGGRSLTSRYETMSDEQLYEIIEGEARLITDQSGQQNPEKGSLQ
jgi:phage terminase small subunit